MSFDALPEQVEAKRLLTSALAEGPAHAYLLYGPPGVGKRDLALLFAAELLGDHARVVRRSHPDLYVLEPLGDQIRIDDIRELRRDLHMRPFEASRRVYLVFGADTMNEDAADALLKDLEEPPPYVVMLHVANDLGPLPGTIRSPSSRSSSGGTATSSFSPPEPMRPPCTSTGSRSCGPTRPASGSWPPSGRARSSGPRGARRRSSSFRRRSRSRRCSSACGG